MTDDDIYPVKRVVVVESYADLEWMAPITDDHLVRIKIEEYLPIAEMKRWCEQHCDDTVAIWSGHPGTNKIFFAFYDSTEAVAFKLRWM